jgi:glucose-6-phosphate-specific signal transduction histidine kinase
LGIDRINPLVWWICISGFTTYIGMNNWIFVKNEIGPLKGLVFFTIFQVLFDVIVYSWYFGWQPKYVIAVLLVAIAGAIVAS